MYRRESSDRSENGTVCGVTGDLKEMQRAESPSLTESERQQLLAWNDVTTQNFPQDVFIPQLVALQAATMPEAIAVVKDGQQLSYRELNERANQLAHYLKGCGVGPDTLVGLCLDRSLDMFVGLLGILKAGGAYVPLDPSYPDERLAFMLEDADISVLVTREAIAGRLVAAHEIEVICVDGDAAQLARESSTDLNTTITADNVAYVIYTSGSTGQPKGVQITHRSLLNLVHWYRQTFGLTASDRTAQFASPSFDVTIKEIWPPLTAGASVHIVDEGIRSVSRALRDWLVEHTITLILVPTIMAESLITLEWPAETRLRFLLTGGDALHHYPPAGLPFTFINNYGPTEATVVATFERVPPTPYADRLPSIGRPIANVQLYVLDEQLRQVPIGVAGELYIGGVGLAKGYLNRPELTAERFIANPFGSEEGSRLYKTGDLVSYLPDGRIEFRGRSDQQVKIRGYRIELNEIESVLDMHPSIESSSVVAREDVPGNRRLVAYLVLEHDAQPSATALRNDLLARLPDYMVPSAFVIVDSFPLNSGGKVDRAALPVPTAANTLRDQIIAAPTTPTEERLVALMAALLGLEQVGIDDDFFALGGHSLLAADLATQITSTFAVELPLPVVFDAPTARQLALEIEQLIVIRLESMSEDEIMQLLQSEQSLA